jgi:Abortive infection C-terminus
VKQSARACFWLPDPRRTPVALRKNDDLLVLVRKTIKVLRLTPDDIASTASAAETIKRMLMNLATLVQGSAELRNAYGTGHGKSKSQAEQRLRPRHARLAVDAAATLGVFRQETHEDREWTAP